MKMPDAPPKSDQILAKAQQDDRVARILGVLGDSALAPADYLHWDELRFRRAPAELRPEEWWFVIKQLRKSQSRLLPLKGSGGDPFYWTPWDSITESLHLIDKGLAGTVHTPEPVTNPELRDQYLIRSLMDEAITSSQLEGAVATREVAKQMIRTGRQPRDKGERMILNNYRTMQCIRGIKDKALTPKLVLELHRTITADTLDDPGAAGRLRNESERVRIEDEYGNVFHVPPPATHLKERLSAMCDFANGKTPKQFLHPALRSIFIHFWLAYDHPFVDGNGRVARALFYWSMLHSGYWLCEFISISQVILKAPVQYYRAFLHTETDDNDATYFFLHQLDVIRKAVDALNEYIKRHSQRMQGLRARLRGLEWLNHRQRALIEHALGHPDADYTIEGHQVSHNVVYQTARTDLLDLEKRKLLTSFKIGRTLYFRPAQGLQRELEKPPSK